MQREIERLEEERIQLKTENRKLARQIGGKVSEHSLRNLTNDSVFNYMEQLSNRLHSQILSHFYFRLQILDWMQMICGLCKNTEMHYERDDETLQTKVCNAEL